jgi:N-acetylmuramoyl-L-alanine amidase
MFRFLCFLLMPAFFAPLSQARAATKVSVTRDEWGHRPGARGFSTVIIDAGHGGKDSGARSGTTGQYEKDLTLDMVKRVQRELSGSVKCVLMRGSDTFVDLDDRVGIANRYNDAILVSIHFNSGPSHIAGPEVYYWRVDSYTLGKRILASLSKVAPYENSNRGLVRRRLRLTRNPDIACVLVECGYLSNAKEAKLIANPDYRARLAKAIAAGILSQRAEGDGRLGPLPRPLNEPPSRATDARE